MRAEGWYHDPFKMHADRWFSDGRPTALVRDNGHEASDPPPVAEYTGTLVEVAVDVPVDGSDLIRADDPSSKPFEPADAANVVIENAISINSGQANP